MLRISLAMAIIALILAAWLIWVRPYLKSLPQFGELWHQEDTAWQAVSVWLDGRRTILIGIWGEVIAFLPDLLTAISPVDIKTAFDLPDNWAAIVNMVVPILMMIFRAKAK